MTDLLKKKLKKMTGVLNKFRNETITFPELIKRFESIEEYFQDSFLPEEAENMMRDERVKND